MGIADGTLLRREGRDHVAKFGRVGFEDLEKIGDLVTANEREHELHRQRVQHRHPAIGIQGHEADRAGVKELQEFRVLVAKGLAGGVARGPAR